jgi:hypothetical protein
MIACHAPQGLPEDSAPETAAGPPLREAGDGKARIGAQNLAGFFAAQPDTTPKLAGFVFAFEHLEIAAYHLLGAGRFSGRIGEMEVFNVSVEVTGRDFWLFELAPATAVAAPVH